LDKSSVNGNPCRETINDSTDARPVTLSKSGQAEYVAEGIAHGFNALVAMAATVFVV
jgi:hypothetical protein